MFVVEGIKFKDKEFYDDLELIKKINPIFAFAIESIAIYEDDEV